MKSDFALASSVHETLCVPCKSGVSVFPSPVEILQSNPTGLQAQIPWGLLVLLPDPRDGKSDVGLRTFISVRELLWCCSPICRVPIWWVWDLI